MSQVNINLNTNQVEINTTNNQISVTNPDNPSVVNITQPVTNVIEVITSGPQGPQGMSGPIPDTGSFVTTGSFNDFTSSYNTGSFSGSFTGNLVGSASFASTASFAQSGNGSFSGSFSGSGANLSGIPSSAITGLNLSQIATGSVTASVSPTQFTVRSGSVVEFQVTGTGVTLGSVITDTHTVTGSLNVSGSITGSLFGTSSFASTASFAPAYLPIAVPQTTGLTISFTQDRVYGTFASPETGSSIISDTGSAILGVTNLIIHSASVAPTTGSDFKKLTGSSDYVAGLNYIYCTYIANNQIIYSINQAT